MDLSHILNHHKKKEADITLAATPVNRIHASTLGIIRPEKDMRIRSFVEKPATDEDIDALQYRPGRDKPFLGSMGMYILKLKLLRKR